MHNHFPPEMFCSGDFDSVVSLLATRYSVNALNLTITTKWGAWYTPDSEVIKEDLQYKRISCNSDVFWDFFLCVMAMDAGGRLYSAIQRRHHVCVSEGSWPYGPYIPAKEITCSARRFPEEQTPSCSSQVQAP